MGNSRRKPSRFRSRLYLGLMTSNLFRSRVTTSTVIESRIENIRNITWKLDILLDVPAGTEAVLLKLKCRHRSLSEGSH